LVDPTILSLLVENELAYHLFISPIVDAKQLLAQMLPHIVPFQLRVHPRQVDRTFPFDKSHLLRYRIFRCPQYHHVHVVIHQITFLYHSLLLTRQSMEYLFHLHADLAKQYLLPAFRDKHNAVLKLPTGVIQKFTLARYDERQLKNGHIARQ